MERRLTVTLQVRGKHKGQTATVGMKRQAEGGGGRRHSSEAASDDSLFIIALLGSIKNLKTSTLTVNLISTLPMMAVMKHASPNSWADVFSWPRVCCVFGQVTKTPSCRNHLVFKDESSWKSVRYIKIV